MLNMVVMLRFEGKKMENFAERNCSEYLHSIVSVENSLTSLAIDQSIIECVASFFTDASVMFLILLSKSNLRKMMVYVKGISWHSRGSISK